MSSCFILSEYVVEETAVGLALIQKLLPGVCDLRRRMKQRFNLLFYLFIFNRVKAIKFKIPGLACYNH